jgi:hypothetical protein
MAPPPAPNPVAPPAASPPPAPVARATRPSARRQAAARARPPRERRAESKRPAPDRARARETKPDEIDGLTASAPPRALPSAAVSATDDGQQRLLMLVLGIGIGLLLIAVSAALPGMRFTHTGRLIAHYRFSIVAIGSLLVAAVCVVLAASVP